MCIKILCIAKYIDPFGKCYPSKNPIIHFEIHEEMIFRILSFFLLDHWQEEGLLRQWPLSHLLEMLTWMILYRKLINYVTVLCIIDLNCITTFQAFALLFLYSLGAVSQQAFFIQEVLDQTARVGWRLVRLLFAFSNAAIIWSLLFFWSHCLGCFSSCKLI